MNIRYFISLPLFIALFLMAGCQSGGETLHIPDVDLLEALIEAGVDRNGDGEISFGEAERVTRLEFPPGGITSLEGIEYFENLDTLIITRNPLDSLVFNGNSGLTYLQLKGCELTHLGTGELASLQHLDCSGMGAGPGYLERLDLTSNPQLKTLICEENRLRELDLTGCRDLQTLHCGYNWLSQLDVSQNPELAYFTCNNNRFQGLNVSANAKLRLLITCGNYLNYLDVSNNQQLFRLGIDNMPGLTAVCVWDLPFPPPGVSILMQFSPNVKFITGC